VRAWIWVSLAAALGQSPDQRRRDVRRGCASAFLAALRRCADLKEQSAAGAESEGEAAAVAAAAKDARLRRAPPILGGARVSK